MQDLILDDVYDVWFTSFWQTWPGYVILVLLVVGVLFGLYFAIKAIKKYRLGTSKDSALRRLSELCKHVELHNTDLRSVYQELTDITKSYCQWRFRMPRGMTDYELLNLLQHTDSSQDHQKEVERVVTDVQAVKFGPVEPSKKQVIKDLEAIIEFITEAGDRDRETTKEQNKKEQ